MRPVDSECQYRFLPGGAVEFMGVYTPHTRLGIVFDDKDGILLKHGDLDHVLDYYRRLQKAYRASGLDDIADSIKIFGFDAKETGLEFLNHIIACSGVTMRVLQEEFPRLSIESLTSESHDESGESRP